MRKYCRIDAFVSRIDEKSEIKKIFDKLFVYNSKEQINRINTKLFLKDFDEIVQEVECPICLQFPLEPIQCANCLKIFCEKCQINNKCPFCRYSFVKKELDRILKNIFGKLLLRCPNCDKYSKSNKLKVSEYISHLKSCDYSDYQCLICKKIIPHSKKDCFEHAHFCGYSDSSCCYCSKALKKYLKKEHEVICGEELVECEFCEGKMERKKIENHTKNLCLMRIINCKDCHEDYKFKDFDAHLKEACKDNQINYWKKKFEEAKLVLEEDFNYKYDEQTIKKRKTLERQNTEVNLFTNLNLDIKPPPYSNNTYRAKEKKALNPFLESSIVKDKDISYINELFPDKDYINFSLVYKMSKDGERNFHKNCDNIGPTITFFKIRRSSMSDSFNRLGGYISLNWDYSEKIKKDKNAFIFSLTRRKVFKAKEPFDSIYCSSFYGPSFGIQGLRPALWTKGKIGGYYNCNTFEDIQKDCTCGLNDFIIEELEVYKVNFDIIE